MHLLVAVADIAESLRNKALRYPQQLLGLTAGRPSEPTGAIKFGNGHHRGVSAGYPFSRCLILK